MRSKLAEICISATKGISSKRTKQKEQELDRKQLDVRVENDGHLFVGCSVQPAFLGHNSLEHKLSLVEDPEASWTEGCQEGRKTWEESPEEEGEF